VLKTATGDQIFAKSLFSKHEMAKNDQI